MKKPIKQKKCKECGVMFTPFNSIEKLCGAKCIIDSFNAKKDKDVAGERIQRKKALKEKVLGESRPYQLKKAQEAINAFVRERDRDYPCISCRRFHTGQYHAGHYRSVGAAPHLRFNQFNIHKQCAPCNTHKSGNAIEYRISLVERIGSDTVELLERENEPKKWTLEEIKAITVYYRKMLKRIKAD